MVTLTSAALRVGDQVEVQVIGVHPLPRIGDRVEAVLVLRTERSMEVLSLGPSEGLTLLGQDVHLERTGGELKGIVPFEIEGVEGPSILTFTLATGDVGATAGKVDIEMDVKPRRTSIGLQGAPFRWSGEGPFEITVSLDNPLRVKGELSARLISPDGEPLSLRSLASSRISFKGERLERLALDPIEKGSPGHYDLIISLDAEHGAEGSFEDAVYVPDKGPELGIFDIGAGSWGRTGIPTPAQPVEARILKDGKEEHLRTRTADGHLELFVPDDAEGLVRIDIMRGSEVLSSGTVAVRTRSALESISISPSEGTVRSGTETICTIMYMKRAATPLRAVLTIGGEGRIRSQADLTGLQGSVEMRFKVPKDMPSGAQPAVLEVFSGEEQVHRSIRQGIFIVMSDLSAQVTIEVPRIEGGGELGPYMFPGEVVRSSETIGRLTVHSLSTGRRLIMLDGKPVFGRVWDEKLDQDVLACYTLLLFREALTEQEFRRSLREAVERFEGMTAPAKESLTDLPPVSKAYAQYVSGKGTDPIIGKVGSFVKAVLAGGTPPHQELIEGVASLWKGTAGSDMAGAVSCLRKCARSAYSKVSSIGSDRSKDDLSIEQALNEIVFLSLLQMEVVSAWSDPALSYWDDLRAVRQRSIRRAVDSALAGVEAIALVSKRSSGRLSSYRNNMAIRRNLASVRDLRLKGRPALSITQSGTLKGTVGVMAGAEGCGLDLYLSLPHHSWGVISPSSTMDSIGHYIGRSEMSIGQTLTLELELSLPQGSKGGTVKVFVKPSKDFLEEET